MKRIGGQKSPMDNLSRRIQELDAYTEQGLLSMDEWNERIEVEKNLENLLILENLQWKQKAGRSWVLHGDANTNFFHQYASRRRKNTISYLESNNGEIRGLKEITQHIVNFYKCLFGHNEPCAMKLNHNFWPEELTLSEGDSTNLIEPFCQKEIKEVIMGMKENSAPGPNGYGVVFFKKFWQVIKGDLEIMFQDFYNNKLDIKRLNYGVPN